MNILFLIATTFALVVVHGNDRPCQRNYDNNAYNRFVWRHIVSRQFNRRSMPAWGRYIRQSGLCDRKDQSFVEPTDQLRVVQICNGFGRPVLNGREGNLCISPGRLLVYDLTVNINNCIVQTLTQRMKYMVVACDVIVNQCLPVHFERYSYQRPNMSAPLCM